MWRISDSELVWNEINNRMTITFSPDSQLLVSTDGLEIRIWPIGNSQELFIGMPACP